MIPRASVILPVRDEARTVRACLEAVLREAKRVEAEVIVVDGLSTDGTRQILSEYPVRVLTAACGAGGARNVGVLAATAPIVAFTDADCVPAQGWLQGLVETLERNPGLAGVGGGIRHEIRSIASLAEEAVTVAFHRGWNTSNVAYRRLPFLEAGGFDETLLCCEDFDLAWRLSERGARLAFLASAEVVHDPPENRSVAAWLGKQFEYARDDVPAYARALSRGSRGAIAHARPAIVGAALPPLLALGLAGGLPWAAAVVAAAWVARACVRAAKSIERSGLSIGLVPLSALFFAKDAVRAAGTWAGLVRLARRGTRGVACSVNHELQRF